MWPTTLDMTRDECRGILRRSELETYSHVISTFRAQGGLSDTKMKILKELRDIFHITQDRHKAEARRAANDEQLCTIAEIISGPNTGQEWTKEGHRNFPLLPRSVPHTALSVIANNSAEVASSANRELPLPAETASLRRPLDFVDDIKLSTKPVVTEDPLVVFMNSKGAKQELKRSHTLSENNNSTSTPSSVVTPKKRISETQLAAVPLVDAATEPPISPPILQANTRIQQLYNTHTKNQAPPQQYVQQQQQYQQQQQQQQQFQLQQHQQQYQSMPSQVKQRKNQTPKPPRVPKATGGNKPLTKAQLKQQQKMLDKNLQKQIKAANKNSSAGGRISKSFMKNAAAAVAAAAEKTNNWSTTNDLIINKEIVTIAPQPQQPVQIVFTSQMDNSSNENLNLLQPDNNDNCNLITESTPVTWLTKPISSSALVGSLNAQPQPQQQQILTNRSIKMVLPQQQQQLSLPSTSAAAAIDVVGIKHLNSQQQQLNNNNILQTKQIKTVAQTVSRKQKDVFSTIDQQQPFLDLNKTTNILADNLQFQSIATSVKMSPTLTSPQQQFHQKQSPILLTPGPIKTTTITGTSGNSSCNSGTKPKIQITNQQIISPTSALKFSPTIQMKQFQSKGNVQLIPASDGRVFIKSSPASSIVVDSTQQSPPVQQQQQQPLMKTAAGFVKTMQVQVANNKVPIQKVQLMPTNKIGGKSNMVVMQKLSSSGTKITMQPNKFGKYVPLTAAQISQLPMSAVQTKKNVVVLDVCEPESDLTNILMGGNDATTKTTTTTILPSKNVITEDTPVDIISGDDLANLESFNNLPEPLATSLTSTTTPTTPPATIVASTSMQTIQNNLKNKHQVIKQLKATSTFIQKPTIKSNIMGNNNIVQFKPQQITKKINLKTTNQIQNSGFLKQSTINIVAPRPPQLKPPQQQISTLQLLSAAAEAVDNDNNALLLSLMENNATMLPDDQQNERPEQRNDDVIISTTDWEDELDKSSGSIGGGGGGSATPIKIQSKLIAAAANTDDYIEEDVVEDAYDGKNMDIDSDDHIIQYEEESVTTGDYQHPPNEINFKNSPTTIQITKQPLKNKTIKLMKSSIPDAGIITTAAAANIMTNLSTYISTTTSPTTPLPTSTNNLVQKSPMDIYSKINIDMTAGRPTTSFPNVVTKVDSGDSSNDLLSTKQSLNNQDATASASTTDENIIVMLKMKEFDESGSSVMKNVSVQELIDSGHIIQDAMDGSE